MPKEEQKLQKNQIEIYSFRLEIKSILTSLSDALMGSRPFLELAATVNNHDNELLIVHVALLANEKLVRINGDPEDLINMIVIITEKGRAALNQPRIVYKQL